MEDKRRRRLLRMQLEFLAELHTDTFRLEEFEHDRLLLKIRAGWVSERESFTRVLLLEDRSDLRRIPEAMSSS